MHRFSRFAAGALIALSLSGCAQMASLFADAGAATTPPTIAQVSTLADAVQAATVATQAVDLYVNTAKPTPAMLKQLNADNEAVHSALKDLEAAQAAGQNLNFAAFNAALDAYNTYYGDITP